MEIGEARQGDRVVLRPLGRLDAFTSGAFQARLLAAVASGCAICIVDLAAVEFMSSAGLQAIMAGARSLSQAQRFGLASANPLVEEILRISRFAFLVPIFATVADATAGLSAPPPNPQ